MIIIMKMVSTHMFPCSRITIISLKMSKCEYIYISSEGDGSPRFMSHPSLVMSKMGEDLADRLLSTTSPACELYSM